MRDEGLTCTKPGPSERGHTE